MVLVDTSVWIRALSNKEPYKSELDKLLSLDEVVGNDLIYGELLISDRGGRAILLADYDYMHKASTIPHRDVIAFVRQRKLHGRGAGWIDIHLLASAIVGHFEVWTADPRFFTLASELGIAYSLPSS
jgi:predicted nucleic acid-binding protein